jgi:beta-barrel assembly-enhancing protease
MVRQSHGSEFTSSGSWVHSGQSFGKFLGKRILPLLLGLAITVLPAQAVPLQQLLIRGVQVIQLSNISPQQEVALGTQMHQSLLSKGTRLSNDAALNTYVREIGQRLLASNSSKSIPYVFSVVEDKAVNAFATTGGYVYVTTELLKTADNEAQLASVIGHEMGHIQKRHLIKQIRQATIARGLVAGALGLDRNVAASLGIELLVSRPNSRSDEFEADQVGLQNLRNANYAASAMPAFMQKLLRPGGTPTFLSTHPAVPDRIRALNKAIETGPKNSCDTNSSSPSCGLDVTGYQQKVKNRLS